MGTLDLEAFRAELLFDLKGRTDTADPLGFSETRQDMFINAGYLHVTHPSVFKHFQLKHRFPITLALDQIGYTFTPSPEVTPTISHGIRYVTHVAATTDDPTALRTKVFPKTEQWFQSRTITTGGIPRNYYLQADILHVSPIPSAAEAGDVIVVGTWREPALLTNAGDVTVLSTLWDEIVLLAARWRAELHLGYRDMAEGTKLDFVSLINEYGTFDDLWQADEDWEHRPQVEADVIALREWCAEKDRSK